MKKIWNKILLMVMMAVLMCSMFAVSAFAAGPGGGADSGGFSSGDAVTTAETGDVAGAVEDTWNAAKGQIKQVVNNVVFPIIDLILAVLFFTKVAMAYMDYRKHGQFEWAPPAILLATLIFSLTCPLYIWNILGM
jgi:hypothetical protein